VGTFLTVIVMPVVYSSLETVTVAAGAAARWVLDLNAPTDTGKVLDGGRPSY
jgi:hypothetical protein